MRIVMLNVKLMERQKSEHCKNTAMVITGLHRQDVGRGNSIESFGRMTVGE
jgi:hypothetical protein